MPDSDHREKSDMKIVIFNEDLRSEMQMYLALSNHYDVSIAEDEDDLMQLLDSKKADYTFLDLDCGEKKRGHVKKALEIASRIQQKHPKTELVGICDQNDVSITQMAAGIGIKRVVTRPIKNREILDALG
ncbi:response regulator [candidate division KSB1 bacterium]|nr:MAG: response regulator [candidate division KSB1 bacterium]